MFCGLPQELKANNTVRTQNLRFVSRWKLGWASIWQGEVARSYDTGFGGCMKVCEHLAWRAPCALSPGSDSCHKTGHRYRASLASPGHRSSGRCAVHVLTRPSPTRAGALLTRIQTPRYSPHPAKKAVESEKGAVRVKIKI